MQAETAVEIDGGMGRSVRARDRDGGTHGVISGFAVRHDDIQAIDRSALKDDDQNVFARRSCIGGLDRAGQPGRDSTHAEHGDSGAFQKEATRGHMDFSP